MHKRTTAADLSVPFEPSIGYLFRGGFQQGLSYSIPEDDRFLYLPSYAYRSRVIFLSKSLGCV